VAMCVGATWLRQWLAKLDARSRIGAGIKLGGGLLALADTAGGPRLRKDVWDCLVGALLDESNPNGELATNETETAVCVTLGLRHRPSAS
jgi:hypothetical protein